MNVSLRKSKKILKYIASGLAASSLLFIAMSFYVTEQMMRPGFYELRTPEQGLKSRNGSVDPKADFGIDFEEVEFPAVNAQTLRGWYVPSEEESDVAVITAHGGGSDRRSYLSFVPYLHDAGYPVLLFDSREHGISDGYGLGMSLGYRESEDVSSAVDFLMAHKGFNRIAVIGTSQGATSVILAAARDKRIGLVVAQGTGTTLPDMMAVNPILQWFPRWAINLFTSHFYIRQGADWETITTRGNGPIDVIHEISPRPLFLIQGEFDNMAPLSQAQENFAVAGDPKQLWNVIGGHHRGLRQHAGEEYPRRVLAFLQQYMPALKDR
jgi:dipeptidyl aminopeptidase/acylaminoacyl peptidase